MVVLMRVYACLIFMLLILLPGSVRAGEFSFYVGEIHPFVLLGENGGIYGAAVDVVKEIMRGVGKPVEAGDMQSISWARAQEIVKTKPAHGLFCMARTSQREEHYAWVGPIAELKLGLIARKSAKIVIEEPSDIRKYRIGVVRSSGPQHILMNSYGLAAGAMELVKGSDIQLRMLGAGRVDLVTQPDIGSPEELRKQGMNPDEFEMVHVIKHLKLYVAFNKDTNAELIQRMQKVLDAMKSGPKGKSRYDRITGEYLLDGPISMQR